MPILAILYIEGARGCNHSIHKSHGVEPRKHKGVGTHDAM